MTARQWLGRARYIDREIAALETALADARDAATRITQNYEADGAQTSKDPHKLDRIAEYADMLAGKFEELIEVKREIAEAILRLEDGRHRTLLTLYYICGKSWEEVAAEMHYQWRQTMRIRREAHEAFEKMAQNGIEWHTAPVI